jgi:NTP pyrophosphatase (non-canonical NTP hydrolase)
MTIQEITDRNYLATVKRGQINKKTSIVDFLDKIHEEFHELESSYLDAPSYLETFDKKELADIALVCFAMAKHYNINLVEAMQEKMLYNEQRID